MSKIPLERHILKQDLWKKIDLANETTNDMVKEVYDKIDVVKKELMDYYDKVLIAYKETRRDLMIESKNDLVKTKKELEQYLQGEVDRLITDQNRFLDRMDKKILHMVDDFNDRVEMAVNAKLGQMLKLSEDLSIKVQAYEKGTRRDILNYHTELSSKFNEMKGRFEEVMGKLRTISSITRK